MPFYLRKYFCLGPPCPNVSKSGSGLSGGIRVAGVGMTSMGRRHVHLGSGALNCRKAKVEEHRRAKGGQMTEEQFIELSLECFQNAENLYRDAVLLGQHDSPRAVALAVIGCEEFAKSVIYAVGALYPEQREMLAKNIRSLEGHEIKHMINAYAEMAQIKKADEWLIERQEIGCGPTPHGKVTDMLSYLGGVEISSLVTSKEKFWEGKAESSKLKENALYVDFRDGRIHTPSEVKERAHSELLGLEFYLEEYGALPEVLSGRLKRLKDGGCTTA